MDKSTTNELSLLVVSLLKGVIVRDEKETRWQHLMRLEARVRDYVTVLGLELVVAEEDGYAFLRQHENDPEDQHVPRLIARRPLSYPVSLLLAILRRRVAEHDATSGDARIVVTVDETRSTFETYLPANSDEAKQSDRFSGYLNAVGRLGFIRFLRNDETRFEIRRLINAFVTAEWLVEFEEKLAAATESDDTPEGTPL
ncbi:MAG: DUF4194 domain-containing protein [Alkalispirochaeta sp.]|jgi:hypothetical protein